MEGLVAAGKRSEAVEYVMTEMIGVPAEYIEPMKQDPSWDEMARYAHTFAYDGRILRGLQDGKPLPADRWSIDAPIAVAIGGDSEPYFRVGAEALAGLLPKVTLLACPRHLATWSSLTEPAVLSIVTRQSS